MRLIATVSTTRDEAWGDGTRRPFPACGPETLLTVEFSSADRLRAAIPTASLAFRVRTPIVGPACFESDRPGLFWAWPGQPGLCQTCSPGMVCLKVGLFLSWLALSLVRERAKRCRSRVLTLVGVVFQVRCLLDSGHSPVSMCVATI